MASRNGKYYVKSVKKLHQQSNLFDFGVVKSSTSRSVNSTTSANEPAIDNGMSTDLDPQTQPTVTTTAPTCMPLESMASRPMCHLDQKAEVEWQHPTTFTEEAGESSEILLATKLATNDVDQSTAMQIDSNEMSTITVSTDARRKTSLKYESTHTWLYHSEIKKGYMCKFCELFPNHGSEPAFAKQGAVLGSHPSRRLKQHAESFRLEQAHKQYVLFQTGQTVSKVKPTEAKKAKTIKKNRFHLKKVIKMVRFLIKKKWGYTENAKDLAVLVADMGDEEMAHYLNQDVNYLSSTSVTEIISSMSTFYKRQVMVGMSRKPFTLFLDESTDNAHRSQASIMARWIGAEGLTERFVDLVHLPGCRAVDFLQTVQRFCNKFDLDPANIRFVALDGCNTMSGEKSGLQRRIRNLAPHSLYVNCRNHKLALCFVHLVKKNEHLQVVEGLLVSIWKLFNYSSKRFAVFQSMQEVYGERPLTFVKASATRWLSHLKASARFIDRYQALIDTLDTLIHETKDPELDGIRARATNREVVFTILLLTDVLKPVNYLSLYLQEDKGYFTALPQRVKACVTDMENIIQMYREGNLQDLEFSKAQSMVDVIERRTDLGRRLRGQQQIVVLQPAEYLATTGIPIVHELI